MQVYMSTHMLMCLSMLKRPACECTYLCSCVHVPAYAHKPHSSTQGSKQQWEQEPHQALSTLSLSTSLFKATHKVGVMLIPK